MCSIPRLGRTSGEGKGYPLQYSGLENSMDCLVHGVSKSWTQLNDFDFDFHFFTPDGILLDNSSQKKEVPTQIHVC